MDSLLNKLSKIKSNFENELRALTWRIERCEKHGAENSKEIKLLDKRFSTELSKFSSKQEEKIPYVFGARDRNQYFSGRRKELQDLQRILQPDDTRVKKNMRIAAVCGLGGIGKTSLVTEYAYRMKKHYLGGVYWFSAEDDMFFEQSINDTALILGALLVTFDLTLTNTLLKIGNTSKPCLIVLDCLDQLNLSSKMLKFLSLVSRQNVSADLIMITRRNKKKLVKEISSLHEDCCLSLQCFEVEEARQFMFHRTGLTPDEDANSIRTAESLVEELGGLPLALEQAGAYIKELDCTLSEYLEQFQIERLKLLKYQEAEPASLYESRERLALHTTWSLNIKHIKESPHGMSAIRLMNAYAFLNPNEIEKQLVNVGERPIEDKTFRDCVSLPLGTRQVVKLLTDFSLFTYVHAHSVSCHRLVQELIRENLEPEEKAESSLDAVRLLSFAFSKCISPKHLLGDVGIQERLKVYDLPKHRSQYYLWSKLCFHGFHLQKNIEKLLANADSKCLDSLFSFETAKVVYSCVIHLSANQRQPEAKRTLNFAYRILDWIPVEEYDTIHESLSNNAVFPSHVYIPLLKWLQIVIKKSCVPVMTSLERLNDKPRVISEFSELRNLEQNIENLRLDGNTKFKDGLYKEAVVSYSSAIDRSRGTTAFNALLLTNRASAYIKLRQLDDALKDADEYIARFPDCWKGYARKALALDEKVSAEIAAALAYYFSLKDGKCVFSEYKPFEGAFPGLKERIFLCHTADQLMSALVSFNTPDCLGVIVLGSQEYVMKHPIASLNCIMIGTKPNASVTIKFGDVGTWLLLEKYMLANLSFVINKGQIEASDGSFVKIFNCNFTSNDDIAAAVASTGVLNAERCNFTNCKAGGLLCVGPGDMIVDNCTFSGNVRAGLEVRENGQLIVRKSRMYNNGVDGLAIGPKAAKCGVIDCQIYHNGREGIAAIDESKCITLMRNAVFENYENGIYIRNSEVDIRENKFFENDAWGIWSANNSLCKVLMNEVFRNKCGGIRIGKRFARKEFPPSVIELNAVHDNIGPGIVEDINSFEDPRLALSGDFWTNKDVSEIHGDYKSAKWNQNSEYKNEESIIVNKSKFFSPWCSSCHGKCVDLKMCGECFTAGYCNKNCQKRHWSKHKKLCNVLRKKSSFLIPSMKKCPGVGINFHAKNLDEVGPNFSDPPPPNGKRFIVKLQIVYHESSLKGKPHLNHIYDRSLTINEKFEDEYIYHLVKEFGVLCERKFHEKKLFLYCVFEESGKLRLFINDFPDFQKW